MEEGRREEGGRGLQNNDNDIGDDADYGNERIMSMVDYDRIAVTKL